MKKERIKKCTLFWDNYSGGSHKIEDYEYIYIELPEQEAIEYFKETFGQSPYDVACLCCGENFSVSTYDSFEAASAPHRGCEFSYDTISYDLSSAKVSVEYYVKRKDVLYIRGGEK